MTDKKEPKIEKLSLKDDHELGGKVPQLDPVELLKRLEYLPSNLVWKNFLKEQPKTDEWFILFCDMGRVAPCLFITYRDTAGNYELPHPTKNYPARAWAYINLPQPDPEQLEKVKQEALDATLSQKIEPAIATVTK